MGSTESFATARDGTRIWWRATGQGSPAIVLTDGIACSGFVWKHLEPALARGRRVIRWNYRGHGRSEAPADPDRISVLDCVDDLLAVLDAAGERRAVLAGHSMGVQVSLEAHRAAPDRTAGLVLVCGSPGRLLDTFHDARVLSAAFPWLRRGILAWPALARFAFRSLVPTELSYRIALRFEVNADLVRREDLFPYLEEVADVDPVLWARMLSTAAVHDASDHLPAVGAPTLIVAGERDTWTPMWLSVRMHAQIPGSELLTLPRGTHAGPIEHPDLVALRIEKFLHERAPVEPPRPAAAPARAAG